MLSSGQVKSTSDAASRIERPNSFHLSLFLTSKFFMTLNILKCIDLLFCVGANVSRYFFADLALNSHPGPVPWDGLTYEAQFSFPPSVHALS